MASLTRTLKNQIASLVEAQLQTALNRAELTALAQAEGDYTEIGPAEAIHCPPPRYVYPHSYPALESKQGPYQFSPPFWAALNDVVLVGQAAVGYTSGRAILETAVDRLDCCTESVLADVKAINARPYLVKTAETLDLAVSLVNIWSQNYFHWLLEGLTRLEALEHFIHQSQHQPRLIVDRQMPPWKRESLRLLGYSPEDFYVWQGQRLRVNTLIIPSFRRQQGRTSPRACRWVAERIKRALPAGSPAAESFSPKIYISRRQATTRKVLNEPSLIEALEALGFRAFCLEEMAFAEQVRLFAQARLIVAPHGSGLANMIFAEPGTQVVEIFGHDYVNPCFYALASSLGFDYASLVFPARQRDIVVEVEKILEGITRV